VTVVPNEGHGLLPSPFRDEGCALARACALCMRVRLRIMRAEVRPLVSSVEAGELRLEPSKFVSLQWGLLWGVAAALKSFFTFIRFRALQYLADAVL